MLNIKPVERVVSQHFSRAAQTYDSAAQLQKAVIAKASEPLIVKLDQDYAPSPFKILDVGCGTSNLLNCLIKSLPTSLLSKMDYTGVDIASGMLEYSQQKFASVSHGLNANWQMANAENLPFSDGQYDCVFSSLAWQWCDLDKVLTQAYRVLKPGGHLIFTTLLDGTLTELNAAYQKLDDNPHTNQFIHPDIFARQLKQINWQTIDYELKLEKTDYQSVYQLLKELKSIGANTVTRDNQLRVKKRLTRQRLAALEAVYPKKTLPKSNQTENDNTASVEASWQVAYCQLKKPY